MRATTPTILLDRASNYIRANPADEVSVTSIAQNLRTRRIDGWYDSNASCRRELYLEGRRIISISKLAVIRYPNFYKPWGTHRDLVNPP